MSSPSLQSRHDASSRVTGSGSHPPGSCTGVSHCGYTAGIPVSVTGPSRIPNGYQRTVCSLIRVYYSVMRTSFHGVIEAVRTALSDLVNTGERATIVFTSSQANSGGTSTASSSPPAAAAEESWWKRWRKRGIVIGIFSMSGATAGVLNYLQIAPWS
jgi:hypothetical protein